MDFTTKTVTMMDLRQNAGAIIDEIIYQKKDITITRWNKVVAIIKPCIDDNMPADNMAARQRNLAKLYGSLANNRTTAEDWIHAYDQEEQDYLARMNKTWQKPSIK